MFCTNCGKELDDNAQFCQFCGQQMNVITETSHKKENLAKDEKFKPAGCLVCCLVFFFLIFILPVLMSPSANDDSSKTKSFTCPSSQELETAIFQYKDANIIGKIQPELNTVYITAAAQKQLSVDDIQTLGYLSACYSAYKKGNNLVWTDIYNYNTGKRIAKYSQAYGFKME